MFIILACKFCTTKGRIECVIHICFSVKVFLLKNTSLHLKSAVSLYLKIPLEFQACVLALKIPLNNSGSSRKKAFGYTA